MMDPLTAVTVVVMTVVVCLTIALIIASYFDYKKAGLETDDWEG